MRHPYHCFCNYCQEQRKQIEAFFGLTPSTESGEEWDEEQERDLDDVMNYLNH